MGYLSELQESTNLCANLRLYYEKRRKQEREDFLSLLLDDEVVHNNRNLQEKYMELYDKYRGR